MSISLEALKRALDAVNAVVPLSNKDFSYIRNYKLLYSGLTELVTELASVKAERDMLKQDCERISEQLSNATRYYVETPSTSIIESFSPAVKTRKKAIGDTNG